MNWPLLFKYNVFHKQWKLLSYLDNNYNKCCLGISTVNTILKRHCYQNTSGHFSFCNIKNSYLFKKNNISMDVNNLHKFKLSDYDCIGFDLDNTLCEYKIKPMVQMEYNVLSRYLVERKGYDPQFLYSPLTSEDVDFLQRGLLLDFERGNVVKLDENATVLKASHGTKELSESDLKLLYGESMKFNYADMLCDDLTCAWNDNLKSKFRLLLDYFDLPASLGFARAIDAINASGDTNYFKVGQDVLSGLVYMYSRENFLTEQSDYFKELKSNPDKYINKCSSELVGWLKEISKSKVLFLVTGSNVDYASFTASHCLGENWLEIFDMVVCYARKPGFFVLKRPFLEVSDLKECDEIDCASLKLKKIYSQGNWKDLQAALCGAVPSLSPRFLYVGDNVVEDIYTPHKNLLCDTLAISEELAAERIWNTKEDHPSSEYIASKRWGSFFRDNLTNKQTLWGSVINKCSKLCLPSVSTLTNIPLNEDIQFYGDIVEGCKEIDSKLIYKEI